MSILVIIMIGGIHDSENKLILLVGQHTHTNKQRLCLDMEESPNQNHNVVALQSPS